ncbi:MAG: aminotransferase class V-fold PLP-dependent enzyme [Oscillospiraceae bacterium]|nr:aminotransferase class V-fold PLP-dependent enzyme [Oscillospiraceae bacterium]
MNLEEYFKIYRDNTVGYNFNFETCYGQKKMVYADWTASGRLYYPIEKKITGIIGPYVGNTHSEASCVGKTMTALYNLSHKRIKEHVNAKADDIIITVGSGMTSAIDKLQGILGLKDTDRKKQISEKKYLSEDDRPVIFLTHMEHSSNYLSWLELDCELVIVKPSPVDVVNLNHLEDLLNRYKSRKLKIGSFTACSNVSGIKTPYYKMAKLMHKYGGLCFVDFAASAPSIDIDMHPRDEEERLDAIFFSPHKFLGGPGSAGVLVFNNNLYENFVPDRPGGGTVTWVNPWGNRVYINNIEVREDGGTPGFLQSIRAYFAIELKEMMTTEKILKREEEILKIVFSELGNIEDIFIIEKDRIDREAIVSICLAGIHNSLQTKIMNDRFGIQVRGGCMCAHTYAHFIFKLRRNLSERITNFAENGNYSIKPGWTRYSFHPIMTDEDVYYICDSIKQLIKNYTSWKDDYTYMSSTNEFVNYRDKNMTDFYNKLLMI